ncbi:MAG: hypothetical protein HC866_09490 [Leptolyngbyaceae cyanobacterium RU_5_1]|nr:hypothetical protein [Leptolyngbyaceae cyanobacterium RU_5_1]
MHLVTQVLKQAEKLPWYVWASLVVLPVGASVFAFSLLNRMDAFECLSVQASPAVSDSTRLYCAQMMADRRQANDLANAIEMASTVSENHPLRTDRDRLIQQWSSRLMELSEALFQEGKLDEAVSLAHRVPISTSIYETTRDRIQEWQKIWKAAEETYQTAQSAFENNELSVAQGEARKLLKVQNHYWRVTRFQDLVSQIQSVRENKKAQKGGRDRKQTTDLLPNKPLTTNDLVARWQQEQASEAAAHLAKARRLASTGDMNTLRQAVFEAEMVFSGTPQFDEAQRLISEWNSQIEAVEDRPYLNRATKLASKGDMVSLQAAISEANNIYFGRALYKEAQSKIDQWTNQVRQLHDQQYSEQLPPNPSDPSNQSNSYRSTDYRSPPDTP